MNPNKVPIFATLRAHSHTRDGRIVFWGSIAQLPLIAMMFWKAWNTFPQQGTEELLLAGFLHIGIPLGLTGAYIQNAVSLRFRQSAVLTIFLVLIACAPFFISLPLLR
jgi:hypothetical protein